MNPARPSAGPFATAGVFRLCFSETGAYAASGALVPDPVAPFRVYGVLGPPVLDVFGRSSISYTQHRCFAGTSAEHACRILVVANGDPDANWISTYRMTWAGTTGPWSNCADPSVDVPAVLTSPTYGPYVVGGHVERLGLRLLFQVYSGSRCSNCTVLAVHVRLCQCC